jgi:hypothetical protein
MPETATVTGSGAILDYANDPDAEWISMVIESKKINGD